MPYNKKFTYWISETPTARSRNIATYQYTYFHIIAMSTYLKPLAKIHQNTEITGCLNTGKRAIIWA